MSIHCPRCGADIIIQGYSEEIHALWRCKKCDQMLRHWVAQLGDHNFPGRLWHCDVCDAILNRQNGFYDSCGYWYCHDCGSSNEITKRTVSIHTESVRLIGTESIPNYQHYSSRNATKHTDYSTTNYSSSSLNSKPSHAHTIGSSKTRTNALILCILLGWCGGHCFYLGHPIKAIIYLFTFGLCGWGPFIDCILILSGKARDENDNPVKNW